VTSVKKFQPENKLAKALTDPSGMLVAQAVKNATRNVENVRGDCIAPLQVKMDELVACGSAIMQTRSAETTPELYRLAREVMSDAGMIGLKAVARAAHSLCELMSAGERHPHQWTGIAVHVEAISILRRDLEGQGASVAAMLEGLEKVSRLALQR
jgi:hypothetical protein